jgi:hypothetical protein
LRQEFAGKSPQSGLYIFNVKPLWKTGEDYCACARERTPASYLHARFGRERPGVGIFSSGSAPGIMPPVRCHVCTVATGVKTAKRKRGFYFAHAACLWLALQDCHGKYCFFQQVYTIFGGWYAVLHIF